jgi:hypothetical protein
VELKRREKHYYQNKLVHVIRSLISVFFLALLAGSCDTPHPNHKHASDAKYDSNVVDFMRFLVNSKGDSSGFRLEDSVNCRTFPDAYQECLQDTTTFTSEERRQISDWIAHPLFSAWTPKLAGGAVLLRADSIRTIFMDINEKGWNYFYERFGYGYNSVGCPLFLRGYKWCLCYTANYCGFLCGEGNLTLYEKKGSQWTVIKTWEDWVN